MLVVPDFPRRSGAAEEEKVRGQAGVGGEHAVGQSDYRVEVELLQQLLLDPGADAIPEERAVGDHYSRTRGAEAALGHPTQPPHDDLEEEQRRLRGLPILGKVALDALFLFAPEW